MPTPDVSPGTIVIHSDIACPWATVAVHRLHQARQRLELDAVVAFDHRSFALEVTNEARIPWKVLQPEIPVCGALVPELGMVMWQGDVGTWPVTTLLALEAVQAAKRQSHAASEQLDLALRRAFFVDSRCISLRHVIRDVADGCSELDLGKLMDDLDHGRCRADVLEQTQSADDVGVAGSPHLFLSDGSDWFNPGIELHWVGEEGEGYPVVDSDDPSVYERILRAAAQTA